MKSRRNWLMVFGILASSFVGGAFSHWLFFDTSAVHAQRVRNAPAAVKKITAERFELVDSKGNIRGLFSTSPEGLPILAIYGKDNKSNASLSVTPDGSAQFTACAQGRVCLSVGSLANGSGTLRLYDKNGRIPLALYSDARDTGLVLYNSKGKARTMLMLAKNETPSLQMFDANGQTRNFTGMSLGKPCMFLFGPDGSPLWSASTISKRSAAPAAPTAKLILSLEYMTRSLKVPVAKCDHADMSLEWVVNFVKDMSGLDIDVNWQALAKAGIGRSQKVNVSLENVPFGDVVRAILSSAEQKGRLIALVPGKTRPKILGFIVTKDRIIISTQEDLEKMKK